jgi:Uma2 family endonuclease
MGVPQPRKRYTPQEYYASERAASYKSDYYDGEIFAMAGGTAQHSRIVTNILGELHARLKGKPCSPYDSNLRVTIRATGLQTYPDASVFCDRIQFAPEDPANTTALNPTVLFEVLSRTTEAYDRGFKADNYRRIESLKSYVLVSQESAHVEVYERQAEGAWLLREAKGLDSQVTIPSIDVTLKLADVYDRVEFQERVSPLENGTGG